MSGSWIAAKMTAIQPLPGDLAFSADKKNWDYLFHCGLPAVSGHDLDRIARAMAAERLAAQA
jgi:hypothetical protein